MSSDPQSPSPAPPRAFTQGVGTVFQLTGGILFLATMTLCCGSSLLGKEATEPQLLQRIGWRISPHVFYSAQWALSVALAVNLAASLGVATAGLGLQATRRSSAVLAPFVTAPAAGFWLVHIAFGIHQRLWLFAGMALMLAIAYGGLFALAMAARREMQRDPPPLDHEVLPADYKVPYSHYHDDPPEVRLARELEERKRKLEVQQKEIELLERRMKKPE